MRFRRIEQLLGQEKIARLKGAFVVVVGLGAVGGYVVEGLARAGVGRLRLVDFDKVSIYNINRQIYALESTVGRYKTEVAAERVRDINPDCKVEVLNCFADAESLDDIVEGGPDIVVDAIDAVNPKGELIFGLQKRGIKILSSMGAALRRDPGFVKVGYLRDVHHCALARMMRKRLRKWGGSVDFLCVYSTEPGGKPGNDENGAEDEEVVLDRGRKRKKLGSLPTLPGIFGLTAANVVIGIIIGD